MKKTLRYLFDPLCGWCYGAVPTLSGVLELPDVVLELLPTGLFSGDGARPMNGEFAAYAWGNDQRIARLTGQGFSERYREAVLGDHRRPFDSGPATLALTAVSLTRPASELAALKAIQRARFVDGQDITDLHTLASILRASELDDAAAMTARPDAELLEATGARVARAQALMREFDAQGVPTFIVESEAGRALLGTNAMYANPQAFYAQLAAA